MEVIIVVALIGIMTAISLPYYFDWMRNASYREAAQHAASVLVRSRERAISLNQKVKASFSLDSSAGNNNNTYEIISSSGSILLSGKFPDGIEILRTEDCSEGSGVMQITFNPDGTTYTNTGYYICISDGSKLRYRSGVANSNSGRIVAQRRAGSTWK